MDDGSYIPFPPLLLPYFPQPSPEKRQSRPSKAKRQRISRQRTSRSLYQTSDTDTSSLEHSEMGPRPGVTQRTENLRRVYVAYRPMISKNNRMRKLKPIQQLVDKYESPLRGLLKELGKDNVVAMIQTLQHLGIFTSEEKAKIKFPELFTESPTRKVNRAISERSAACSAQNTINRIEMEEGRPGGGEIDFNQPVVPAPNSPSKPNSTGPSQYTSQPTGDSKSSKPTSLYTTFLPYSAQHAVLSNVQRILEEAFWDWGRKWVPSFVDNNCWDCAAAVELTTWLYELQARRRRLPQGALKSDVSELPQIVADTKQIRHTTVHRLPVTARVIDTLLLSSIKLANILGDQPRASLLENLHLEIERFVLSMLINKNSLDTQLDQALQDIHRQQEELRLKEQSVVKQAIQDDRSHMHLTGRLLQESVKRIFDGDSEKSEIDQMDTDDTGDTLDIGEVDDTGEADEPKDDTLGNKDNAGENDKIRSIGQEERAIPETTGLGDSCNGGRPSSC